MENQEKLAEIHKLVHEKQGRFVYYIVGLSVAAIAFSINKTTGDKFTCTHIYLGLAVLFWSISVFCGLKFLQMTLEVLYVNRNGLDAIEANKANTREVERKLVEYVDKKDPIANELFSWMLRLFYLGLVFFLVWHIVQMAKN